MSRRLQAALVVQSTLALSPGAETVYVVGSLTLREVLLITPPPFASGALAAWLMGTRRHPYVTRPHP